MTVLLRALPGALHVRDGGDGRTLVGPVLPWGVEALVLDRGREVVETFAARRPGRRRPGPGAAHRPPPDRRPAAPHRRHRRAGRAADAAWGAWRVSKTALGDEVLELARDGVPLGLSVGFMEVPGGSRWSADRRRVTRTRAAARPRGRRAGARLCRRRRAGRTGRPRPGDGLSAGRPGPAAAVAMARSARDHRRWLPLAERQRHDCVGCRRPIIYGERCQDCQRQLRLRKRRKPR